MANISLKTAINLLTNAVSDLADKVKTISTGSSNQIPTNVYTLDAYGSGENSGFPEIHATQTMIENTNIDDEIGIVFSGKDDLSNDYDYSDITVATNQWIVRTLRGSATKFENVYYDVDGAVLVRFSDREFKEYITGKMVVLELKQKPDNSFFWRFKGIRTV